MQKINRIGFFILLVLAVLILNKESLDWNWVTYICWTLLAISGTFIGYAGHRLIKQQSYEEN